jgi:hypothetical protein
VLLVDHCDRVSGRGFVARIQATRIAAAIANRTITGQNPACPISYATCMKPVDRVYMPPIRAQAFASFGSGPTKPVLPVSQFPSMRM